MSKASLPAPDFRTAALKPLGDALQRHQLGKPIPIPVAEKAPEGGKKKPTYNLNMEQIEQMKRDAAKEAIEVAWTLMLGLPCMPLMDKFGFDSEKIGQYLDEVMDYFDSYEKGYISLKDVHDCVLEEAGYDIIELRVLARHKKHPQKGPFKRRKR